jgi:hypothetical protein
MILDDVLEKELIEDFVHAFQEQQADDQAVVACFATAVEALGLWMRAHVARRCSVVLWRPNNKNQKIRQLPVDLATDLATTIQRCEQVKLLLRLGVIIFEYLSRVSQGAWRHCGGATRDCACGVNGLDGATDSGTAVAACACAGQSTRSCSVPKRNRL